MLGLPAMGETVLDDVLEGLGHGELTVPSTAVFSADQDDVVAMAGEDQVLHGGILSDPGTVVKIRLLVIDGA